MVALREFYLNKGYLTNFAIGTTLLATGCTLSTLPVALRLIQFGIGAKCLGKALSSLTSVIDLAQTRDHAPSQAVQLTQRIIRSSKGLLNCVGDSFVIAGVADALIRIIIR